MSNRSWQGVLLMHLHETSLHMHAQWKPVFRQETQFIVKNAGVFGTKTGNIWQVIDTSTRRLQNVITFPPLGISICTSLIAVCSTSLIHASSLDWSDLSCAPPLCCDLLPGSFIVDSSIDPEPDSQRIDFKFDAASLTVNGRKFGVPPFGKGWWGPNMTMARL